ncbi:CSC1/OSCA1-like, 7TM region [Dillenia turbinata]|uniref:CSC1/OSCA1-like, 7TM region n=1 Tax=Dillenia turbinata TaxID=194707 RepID=A0AAN8W251_9MAGN
MLTGDMKWDVVDLVVVPFSLPSIFCICIGPQAKAVGFKKKRMDNMTRYAALVASEVLQSSNPMLWVTDLAPEPHDEIHETAGQVIDQLNAITSPKDIPAQLARAVPEQILNVYVSKYDTGGQYWPIAHNTTIFSLVLTQILIEMDWQDEQSGRMEEIHQQLRSAYSQFPISSHDVCVASNPDHVEDKDGIQDPENIEPENRPQLEGAQALGNSSLDKEAPSEIDNLSLLAMRHEWRQELGIGYLSIPSNLRMGPET